MPVGNRKGPTTKDAIEKLLIRLNRSKFAVSEENSMTTVAAKEALKIFRQVIKREAHGNDAAGRVLKYVVNVGQHLNRAPAFRLLLANVTRRVLWIVRDAAASAKKSSGDDHAGMMRRVESRCAFDYNERLTDSDDDEVEASAEPSPARENLTLDDTAEAHSDHDSEDSGDLGREAADRPDDFHDGTTPPTETLLSRLDQHFHAEKYDGVDRSKFRDIALEGLDDFDHELETMLGAVCDRAPDHVYDHEVVMTYGCSHTMLKFFDAAAKVKQYRVIAVEPEVDRPATGRLISTLTPKGVDVELLPDSSAFAVMSRVSKVFIATEAILANGGLLAPTGTLLLCMCAKHCAVPVVVVATTIKISPYYPADAACTSLVKMSRSEAKEMQWSAFAQPARVLPPEHVHAVGDPTLQPQVFNPVMEYVPPELVSLYITNEGEFTAPIVFRYLREQYHAEDTHI